MTDSIHITICTLLADRQCPCESVWCQCDHFHSPWAMATYATEQTGELHTVNVIQETTGEAK